MPTQMPGRIVTRFSGPFVLLGLLLLGLCSPARCAAEEVPIKFDDIKVWAKTDPKPEPPKADPKVDPKPPEVKPEPPKPAWVPSRPGERRPLPDSLRDKERHLIQDARDSLENAKAEINRTKNWEFGVGMAWEAEQYDLAMQYLSFIPQERKYKDNHDHGPDSTWFFECYWSLGLLAQNKPSPELIKGAYLKWEEKAQAGAPDGNWLKSRQVFYKEFAKIEQEIKDLDIKGDGDPNALWMIVDKYYWPGLPSANVHCTMALYKLREWYPNFAMVESGEVQWRICDRLHHHLRNYDDAMKEMKLVMERWPKFGQVQGGEASWLYALELIWTGKDPRAPHKDLVIQGITVLENFQKNYGKHGANQPKPGGDPNQGKTDAGMTLDDAKNWLKKH